MIHLLGESDIPATTRSMDIDFGRPLAPPYAVRVSSGWEAGRSHPGIDIEASIGTPVVAIADGVVITADHAGGGDAGKWVAIQHGHGWVSRSMHFSLVMVVRGQVVRKGQIIGMSGTTGKSSGPHLHLDLKLAPEWVPLVEREVGGQTADFHPRMDGRLGVPAEPWVPVDSYRPDVLARAARNNVMLYAARVKTRIATDARAARRSAWIYAAFGISILGAGTGMLLWLFSQPSRAARAAHRPWFPGSLS